MKISPDEFKKRFPQLTAEMTPEQIAYFIDATVLREIKAGKNLITYGTASSDLFLVWDGQLSVVIDAEDKHLVLAEIGPGKWVGEITWIDPGTASATVTAVTDSALLALSRDALKKMRKEQPSIASLLFQTFSLDLAERLRNTSTQLLKRISDTEYRLEKPQTTTHKWLLELGRKLMGVGGESR